MVAHRHIRTVQNPSHILGTKHDVCDEDCSFLVVSLLVHFALFRYSNSFAIAVSEERLPKSLFGAKKRVNI